MRIGFDVSQTGAGRTGCGWYARGLIEALAAIDGEDEFILYPTFGDLFWSPDGGRAVARPRRRNVRGGLRHRSLQSMQDFWRSPAADWERQLGDPDIVHANNYYCPKGLRQARLVYTLYDLGFLEEPDWSTEANRIGCFSGVFEASISADLVVAISEFSRDDFLRRFPYYPAERISVVYPGNRFVGDAARRTPAFDLRAGEFWLHVGTDEPRKNLDHLLSAYATLRSAGKTSLPLVLAGANGWLTGDLVHRCRAFGIADHVVITGYVDEAQLRWLYESCFAFVFPSRFEGFGMPVLEAMGLAAPVIAAATSSIPEIAGDCAILVDACDPSSTARAMRDLVEQPERRRELATRGRERARRFSWEASAQRLLEAYRNAMQRPRRRDEI